MFPLYHRSPLWTALFWSAFAGFAVAEAWIHVRDRRPVAGERRDRGSRPLIQLLIGAA